MVNIINRLQLGASSFSEAYLERTSRLSVLGLEQFGDGWSIGKFSRVRMSEDKVRIKDSCWSVGMVYDLRGLPGVSTTGPGVDEVLHNIEIFNQVFTLKTANEIWLKLHELHDDISNVHEQKHCLVLNEYISYTMKENELVRDMYSRLNLVINEPNSIGINKLGDADIVRKIISLRPQQRYGSIITILHNLEDLSTMTETLIIGKIVAFEMSCIMGQEEEPTSSKPYAFACDENKRMKGKRLHAPLSPRARDALASPRRSSTIARWALVPASPDARPHADVVLKSQYQILSSHLQEPEIQSSSLFPSLGTRGPELLSY
jgi:hypothetical protein